MQQSISKPIRIMVLSYQEDYTLEQVLDQLNPIHRDTIQFEKHPDPLDKDEVNYYLVFTFNDPKGLTAFLIEAIKYATIQIAGHGADDDYFDYIPLFLEEYRDFLVKLIDPVLKNRPKDSFQIEYYTRTLQNTLILSIQFFNTLLEHQDDQEICNNPDLWFSGAFPSIIL